MVAVSFICIYLLFVRVFKAIYVFAYLFAMLVCLCAVLAPSTCFHCCLEEMFINILFNCRPFSNIIGMIYIVIDKMYNMHIICSIYSIYISVTRMLEITYPSHTMAEIVF